MINENRKELPIIARIRKNNTGEIRDYEDLAHVDDDENPILFNWEDGNYSCDCNRTLFFSRSKGEDEDWDGQCSDGKFSVNIFLDNKCIYREY